VVKVKLKEASSQILPSFLVPGASNLDKSTVELSHFNIIYPQNILQAIDLTNFEVNMSFLNLADLGGQNVKTA